ncbi:histidine kinase dimerization/phospho-acceptor domain-containing protein [Microbulbifer sp. 2304DJ12-6]|uniref:sensor histidine kinase n=1 Tax=Microbulbifer sp. 2304DJ12-6 TaxID=3233340 RepID=UPI0039AFEEFC
MKKSTLSSRLYKTLFLMIAVTIVISLITVDLFVEDIEYNALNFELNADAEFFKTHIDNGQFKRWRTGNLEAVFLPSGEGESRLPEFFRNRPVPLSAEIAVGNKTLLIIIEKIDSPPGKLFLARDFTILERREVLVKILLLSIALIMLVVGFLVAKGSAKLLTRPLKRLSRDIQKIQPGIAMERLTRDYRDSEFVEIAESFNRFLCALESHIHREKSFVKLASHELRTPLAIISGALEILEQRRDVSQSDQKTLLRIRNATRTMQEDTEMLLQLARGKTAKEEFVALDMVKLTAEIVADLGSSNGNFKGRTEVIYDSAELLVYSNAALVRMLLRNLIKNALMHTAARVQIRLGRESIHINDFGSGLPQSVVSQFSQAPGKAPGGLQESSFGLLIVQLISERLNWQLDIEHSGSSGTHFIIRMPACGQD